MTQQEEVQAIMRSREGEERRRARYEEACSRVPSGHLSAYDVCRLWDGANREQWSNSPGIRAAELVRELALPLLELGQGHYVVAHTLEGLA